MKNWLRLTLASFIWLNAISYADTTDLELQQVKEYSYYSDGKLSIERIYDKDEILRKTRYYYYGKYGIVAVEEKNENDGNRLFAYEYKNGNLVKIYEVKKVWNYSNGTTKYEAVGKSKKEYEYNRYGNLVYGYRHTSDGSLITTRYEYNSSGKLALATESYTESYDKWGFYKIECGYDSDGKLIEEVRTGEQLRIDIKYEHASNIKYEYDGNLLYSSNITANGSLAVKVKYEYNSAGQLIRIYEFGNSYVDGDGYCRPLHSEIAFAYRQNDSFYYP